MHWDTVATDVLVAKSVWTVKAGRIGNAYAEIQLQIKNASGSGRIVDLTLQAPPVQEELARGSGAK